MDLATLSVFSVIIWMIVGTLAILGILLIKQGNIWGFLLMDLAMALPVVILLL